MGKLQIIKSEKFGQIEADIYSNGQEMFMTIEQLAQCLEYASKSGIENILGRNEYLRSPEFSTTHKLGVVEGGRSVTRGRTIFTEDGIYEVTMLSGQPKAKEFRSWMRSVLKSIRKHGLYAVDELIANPDLAIKALTALKEEREQRRLAETEREKLKIELDYSKEWLSIKRVAAMNGINWKSIDWRRLKNASVRTGFGVKKIFDANYGEVNTYHMSAWELAYPSLEI